MKWMDSLKHKISQTPPDVTSTVECDSLESPESLRSLIHHHPDAVCLFDFKGDPVTYNERLLKLVGLANEDDVSLKQILTKVFKHFNLSQAEKGHVQTSDEVLAHQNGDLVHVKILHIPMVVEGEVKGSLGIVKDTSEMVKTEKTFTKAITKMRKIMNHLDIAIWAVDFEKGKVIFCSDAVKDIYGVDPKDFEIDTWRNLIHPEDLSEVIERQKKLNHGETIRHSYRIITSGGSIKWIKDHSIPIRNSDGKLFQIAGFVADISETKALQHKLQQMAYHDELTQLPNRYYCRETINQWIVKHRQESKTFALFYLNLDGLNRVNDTFGHEIGDEVLRKTAQKIKTVVPDNGVVCRIGGDEFIVLVPHREQLNDYYQTVQNLIDVSEEPLRIEGYDIFASTSAGISIFLLDSMDYITLVRNARVALSRAKGAGKAGYQVYAANMDIESYKLFQLEGDLRKAVENSELYLEYQPRISTRTQQAEGAEALIRWKHPTWGVVSPSEFIPLAEENSKIIQQIGDYVIRTVCKQIKKWEAKGIPFSYISLNLSAKNFLKGDLADRMKDCLDSFGVSASKIEIEITEGSLLQSTEAVESQLNRLQEMGVRIALDDYGTGYSSIHYLKKHPVSTIKVDRSFVQHITDHQENAVIVKSIIDLGKGLRKRVVAEGIETREQFDLLKKYGCDEIQGYLFSKSVSGAAMAEIFLKDKVQPKQQTVSAVERRQYYRIDLPLPLSTQMTILTIKGESLALGSSEVLVLDLGLGGLRFMSHLRLMSQSNIVYGFETKVMGTDLKLIGKIVWDQEIKMDLFQYGVEFLIEEGDRDKLAILLNHLSLKLRSNPLFNDGHFIAKNAEAYMNEHYL